MILNSSRLWDFVFGLLLCVFAVQSIHLNADFVTAVFEVFTVSMWADSHFPLLLWTTERVPLVGLYQGSWHYLIELCI